jgi:hypothetical protein
MIASERQRKDETAYGEEEIDAALAIFKDPVKGTGEGASGWHRSTLNIDVRDDDDHNGEEAEAVNLGNEAITSNDSPKSNVTQPSGEPFYMC